MSKVSKNHEKNSFVMYDSFLEAMKHLDDNDFRECVLKIRDYALEGVDEESSSPMVNVIMAMAKPNLDSARRRYMASVENGKKGAEYGKLGGAPKGNHNARKKQPQKQPHDVDVNDDVEVEVHKEVNVNGDDDGDNPSGSIGFQSSFSNSSNSVLREGANESERLKEREEIKEPRSEEHPSSSNDFEVDVASEEKGETSIYSKDDNSNSASSPCSEEEAGSCSARPRHQKAPGMDMSEYIEHCFANGISKLADMRRSKLPQDDNLFWRTVGYYCDLYGDNDKSKAAKIVSKIINEYQKQSN